MDDGAALYFLRRLLTLSRLIAGLFSEDSTNDFGCKAATLKESPAVPILARLRVGGELSDEGLRGLGHVRRCHRSPNGVGDQILGHATAGQFHLQAAGAKTAWPWRERRHRRNGRRRAGPVRQAIEFGVYLVRLPIPSSLRASSARECSRCARQRRARSCRFVGHWSDAFRAVAGSGGSGAATGGMTAISGRTARRRGFCFRSRGRCAGWPSGTRGRCPCPGRSCRRCRRTGRRTCRRTCAARPGR